MNGAGTSEIHPLKISSLLTVLQLLYWKFMVYLVECTPHKPILSDQLRNNKFLCATYVLDMTYPGALHD